ncbi:MAG: hypothetical protein L0G95_14360 [Planococcus sp. (in: firmicutes)]|uniref:hypothetical protein n=1 Tax=Planococcus alpniumensis TaxID=2708345 RepID=UPI001B8B9D2C|nr:hypothetical protein [Planococcus sp. MSAK28401]MDN5710623.1 hypothetical protein [Planococcus sp. (in: firmicutes)]
MKTLLLYLVPLIVYALMNNLVNDSFTWPQYLILLFAFLAFQLGRLRYPKNEVPPAAKVTQAVFYVLTVAIIFRDKYLDAGLVNLMIALVAVFVIVEWIIAKPQQKANT